MAFRLQLVRNFNTLRQVCSSKFCAIRVGPEPASSLVLHRTLSCITEPKSDPRYNSRLHTPNAATVFVISKRFKKRSSKVTAGDQDESDSDDDLAEENPLLADEEEEDDGRELATILVSSTRLDSVAKSAFASTRAKIEEQFYKGELLVNGLKPQKKSENVRVGDEIDLVKHVDSEDRSRTHVKRARILEVPDLFSDLKMKIKIARWQDLVIETQDKQ